MGIEGLSGFIQRHFKGWLHKELRGYLVVDGYNIRQLLWKGHDCLHGGQFEEYKQGVLKFYRSLLDRDVIPIVILDGIRPPESQIEEWSTEIEGKKNKMIEIIRKHLQDSKSTELVDQGIFPALGSEIYKQALIELGIECLVVDGNAADATIVSIANHYNCPILSNDSDFYIYKVNGGVINFRDIKLCQKEVKVYCYRTFCEQFKFRDESFRLIIPASSRVNRSDKSHSYIHSASSCESLEDFMNKTTGFKRLSDDEKSNLHRQCSEIYDSDEVFDVQKLTCYSPVPSWVMSYYRKGLFPKHLFRILLVSKKCTFPNLFVEDTASESCMFSSMTIRKYIYGIFGCVCVTEHILNPSQSKINARVISCEERESYMFIFDRPLPSLYEMPKLSVLERERLLYDILRCDRSAFEVLDGRWKLILAATMFWKEQTKPPAQLVKSLLLSLLFTCHVTTTATVEVDLEQLHWFAKWQSCYMDAIHLNAALMFPVSVCPYQLCNGKQVMYYAASQHIEAHHLNVQLFQSLLRAIGVTMDLSFTHGQQCIYYTDIDANDSGFDDEDDGLLQDMGSSMLYSNGWRSQNYSGWKFSQEHGWWSSRHKGWRHCQKQKS